MVIVSLNSDPKSTQIKHFWSQTEDFFVLHETLYLMNWKALLAIMTIAF